MKVEVRIHKEDLIKVVEVDEDEFPSMDTSTNTEIRKYLLEQLEDEYKQVEIFVAITGGGSILNEKTPDMKVSKKNGSYFIEK